jgi:crossover junction endodeoxyribonuclease RuvC
LICGIDPGYRTGGVSVVSDGFAETHDLPIFTEGGVDVHALLDILTSVKIKHIYIEKQQAMPRQGVVSMFKLGLAFGQVQTCVALSLIPFTLVRPVQWKKFFHLPKDKDAARLLAIRNYPQLANQLKRKKDEHRAESLLIAKYGSNQRD